MWWCSARSVEKTNPISLHPRGQSNPPVEGCPKQDELDRSHFPRESRAHFGPVARDQSNPRSGDRSRKDEPNRPCFPRETGGSRTHFPGKARRGRGRIGWKSRTQSSPVARDQSNPSQHGRSRKDEPNRPRFPRESRTPSGLDPPSGTNPGRDIPHAGRGSHRPGRPRQDEANSTTLPARDPAEPTQDRTRPLGLQGSRPRHYRSEGPSVSRISRRFPRSVSPEKRWPALPERTPPGMMLPEPRPSRVSPGPP